MLFLDKQRFYNAILDEDLQLINSLDSDFNQSIGWQTPLFHAVCHNRYSVVKALINKNVAVNKPLSEFSEYQDYNYTATSLAIDFGYDNIHKLLVENGGIEKRPEYESSKYKRKPFYSIERLLKLHPLDAVPALCKAVDKQGIYVHLGEYVVKLAFTSREFIFENGMYERFWHTPPAVMKDCVKALREIQANKSAAVLEQAMSLAQNYYNPPNLEYGYPDNYDIYDMSDEEKETLDELDDDFINTDEDIYQLIMNYIRSNKAKFEIPQLLFTSREVEQVGIKRK